MTHPDHGQARCPTADYPMALALAVHDTLRTVGDRDGERRVLITFTPDALPVLADILPDLWAVQRLWGFSIEYPEDAEPDVTPRLVHVRAEGSSRCSRAYVTAEAVRDSVMSAFDVEAL